MNTECVPDEFDMDGTNVTASRLLNEHHELVGVSGYGDGIADNCEVCGFAAGCIQIAGQDDEGHATAASSAEVREWIQTEANDMTTANRETFSDAYLDEVGPVFAVHHRAYGSPSVYWGPFPTLRAGMAWANKHKLGVSFVEMKSPESSPSTWWE